MTWNPSPEVTVARDAAKAIGSVRRERITRCVVLYATEHDFGYSSYGPTKPECADARELGDTLFDAASKYLCGVGYQPPASLNVLRDLVKWADDSDSAADYASAGPLAWIVNNAREVLGIETATE